MQNYFSADWHLGHKNVIKYDNRPFKDVEEMDRIILENVTTQLQKGDNFYYDGDFALTRSTNTMEGYMKALAYTEANLFFIKGNHDKRDTIRLYEKYGTYLGEQNKIRIIDPTAKNGSQEIVLNHFPMRSWDKSHHGSWCLYGHEHDSLETEIWGRSMDIGIVSAYRILGEYTIFSYEQIRDILTKRPLKFLGHHTTERE